MRTPLSFLRSALAYTLVATTAVGGLSGCSGIRLRQPTAEEQKRYVFSKNIDRAIIDPNESGPLDVVRLLASEEDHDFAAAFAPTQEFLKGDVIRVGYDDGEPEMAGGLSADDKGQVIVITSIVIGVALLGVAAAVLYWLKFA